MVVQSVVVLLALVVVLVTFVVDLLYVVVNPRLERSGA
jgi:ABC-type dipeptide/oligopeptide/nickel transport system permease component